MHAIILAATIICQAGSTCIVPQGSSGLNPTEKAMQDFRAEQQRIQPKVSEQEKAQQRFKEDQQRLLCANHPDQC